MSKLLEQKFTSPKTLQCKFNFLKAEIAKRKLQRGENNYTISFPAAFGKVKEKSKNCLFTVGTKNRKC